jgi:hypothetical protein
VDHWWTKWGQKADPVYQYKSKIIIMKHLDKIKSRLPKVSKSELIPKTLKWLTKQLHDAFMGIVPLKVIP